MPTKRATKQVFARNRCKIMAVGKRRDGGRRFWCLRHQSNATAKYGKPKRTCDAAGIKPIGRSEILELRVDDYKGGVALWGAVPAVYDTTRLPVDRGIHVHARPMPNASKEMDCTYRAVRIYGGTLPVNGIFVSELDAIYYMVSSVFGFGPKEVTCPDCGYSHLDKDWFSIHPHRRHLCAGCGRYFRDSETGIGNPVFATRLASQIKVRKPQPSPKKLDIRQADYPGGIQIWGSNPAFLWTSERVEREGIHVHAFKNEEPIPAIDETYRRVTIDGVRLDSTLVRVLMAQIVLPSLKGRVVALRCPSCGKPHASAGELAFTPTETHNCCACGHEFKSPGRLRKVVSNPLLRTFDVLASGAPRSPQTHDLHLVPETL